MFILQLPVAEVGSSALPPPYRDLLDHEESMTFRLERHHGQRMRIEVIARHMSDDDVYEREIVMIGCDDNQPKQMAHIRIHLTSIPDVRDQVLDGRIPFGRILADHAMPVVRHDRRFLRFPACGSIGRHLQGTASAYFGRRYTLASVSGGTIAEVVEIVR
jgi:chorismate-pyruvate lyase